MVYLKKVIRDLFSFIPCYSLTLFSDLLKRIFNSFRLSWIEVGGDNRLKGYLVSYFIAPLGNLRSMLKLRRLWTRIFFGSWIYWWWNTLKGIYGRLHGSEGVSKLRACLPVWKLQCYEHMTYIFLKCFNFYTSTCESKWWTVFSLTFSNPQIRDQTPINLHRKHSEVLRKNESSCSSEITIDDWKVFPIIF